MTFVVVVNWILIVYALVVVAGAVSTKVLEEGNLIVPAGFADLESCDWLINTPFRLRLMLYAMFQFDVTTIATCVLLCIFTRWPATTGTLSV